MATVSNFVASRLMEGDVERIFGYSGDGAMQMQGLFHLMIIASYRRRRDVIRPD